MCLTRTSLTSHRHNGVRMCNYLDDGADHDCHSDELNCCEEYCIFDTDLRIPKDNA